jgi:hypothetical protein
VAGLAGAAEAMEVAGGRAVINSAPAALARRPSDSEEVRLCRTCGPVSASCAASLQRCPCFVSKTRMHYEIATWLA